MSRLLPHPLLTLALIVLWMALNAFTPGHLLLGLAVGLFASWAMAALEPRRIIVGSWPAAIKLTALFIVDIFKSNLGVVRTILFPRAGRRDGFATIPLSLRDRTALGVLALIINNTPGTAWLEYDTQSGVLLIHVLDYRGDQEIIDLIQKRYEPLLREIFE